MEKGEGVEVGEGSFGVRLGFVLELVLSSFGVRLEFVWGSFGVRKSLLEFGSVRLGLVWSSFGIC